MAATDAILANQIETSILARFIDYFINTDEFRKSMNFDLKVRITRRMCYNFEVYYITVKITIKNNVSP